MSPVATFTPNIILPEGFFQFRAIECKEQTQRDKPDEPFNSWSLEVINDCEQLGQVIRYNTSKNFGPNSKTYTFMKALGLEELEERAEMDTDAFIGAEFWGNVIVTKNMRGDDKNDFKGLWTNEGYEAFLNQSRAAAGPRKVGPKTAGAPAGQVARPQQSVAARPQAGKPQQHGPSKAASTVHVGGASSARQAQPQQQEPAQDPGEEMKFPDQNEG